MDAKIRVLAALLANEGKAKAAEPKPAEEVAGGIYAPRAPRLVPFRRGASSAGRSCRSHGAGSVLV